MYKLYNVKAWGSLSIHCLLEEMEVPYTNIWMTAEQVRAPEFREISPLGLIPALGLDDGRTMIESAAIVSFLTTAHPEKGMAPEPGSSDHGEFLSWLHFLSTEIYPFCEFTFPGNAFAMDDKHGPFVVDRANERINRCWQIVENRLQGEGPWMMGETYSALDIYAFMLSLWAQPSETDLLACFPAVANLAAGVRARPMLKAPLEAHGVMAPGGYGS
ncbi:MAG: glutathione S-transferase family protein [Alphaproteobacteria bacterium]|nr:glutathione S-transferase family protein [Alphaproteobacteria bacterium]